MLYGNFTFFRGDMGQERRGYDVPDGIDAGDVRLIVVTRNNKTPISLMPTLSRPKPSVFGTRPTATRIFSALRLSFFLLARFSTSTSMPDLVFFRPFAAVPARNFTPSF
jgi:hypothetical protein